MVLQPRISEQTYALSQDNVYVFNVPTDANKTDIRSAVEKQFDVTVTKINTTIAKGKSKASARRNRRPIYGNRKDIKKAYVTLKDGDKLTIFEDLE